MASIEVSLKIDEVHFFPNMRVLKALPGIADIFVDLDKLGGSRKSKKDKPNGDAAPVRSERGAKTIVLGFLFQNGPQNTDSLKALIASKGFSETGIHSTLSELRKQGFTESAGTGIHKLTEKASAALQEQSAPRLALPPPKEAAAPAKRIKVAAVVLRLLQASLLGRMTRPELTEALQKHGLAARSIDNAVYKMRAEGFVKATDGSGIYELTAKGKKLELTPNL